MTSRATATARLLRAVAAFGAVGALALAGVSGPASAQTDAPAPTGSSAAAESKGKITGSVKLEDGKKFSSATVVVYRKVPEGGEPQYGGVWKYMKFLSFGANGMGGARERLFASAPSLESAAPKSIARWDYTIKHLPAGTYRLVGSAFGNDLYGPQSYPRGASLLSGESVKVRAGKTTKDVDFKLVKAKKEMTDVELVVTGDPVVGETLTALVTGVPSGAEVTVTWLRTDEYTFVGGGETLTLTPELEGLTLEVSVVAYKLGWRPAGAYAEFGPITAAG